MRRMKLLKWWIVFLASLSGLYFAGKMGFIRETYDVDYTKLSFISLLVYILSSMRLGYYAYRYPKSSTAIKFGWFASELCLSLGLLGTLIGFLSLLSNSLGNLDVNNVETIKKAISEISSSSGTALITTIWGLSCGMILKCQCFILEGGNESS